MVDFGKKLKAIASVIYSVGVTLLAVFLNRYELQLATQMIVSHSVKFIDFNYPLTIIARRMVKS